MPDTLEERCARLRREYSEYLRLRGKLNEVRANVPAATRRLIRLLRKIEIHAGSAAVRTFGVDPWPHDWP